jgi:hypothetical protein
MDYLGPSGNYTKFFDNTGFNNIVPNKLKKHIMNGDILQLISINNEAGIEEFDLQDRKYAVYSPRLLDVEEYPDLLNGGPLPINLQLDPLDGYRVRSCLNEPSHDDGSGNMTNGRLTESSQLVPFYLWDKKGTGFGDGINQSWDYSSVQIQPLQGMTYGYRYSGETSHPYILFPMTKEYGGLLLTYTGITFNDVYANVESDIVGTHFGYNNQEEGFTVLEVNNMVNPTSGVLWTRKGNVGGWVGQTWTNDLDFVIKPTSDNYLDTKQILSTPFLFYFGLRPGKTAVDKFYERFGPKGAFPSAE